MREAFWVVALVDADASPRLMERYEVSSLPTVVVLTAAGALQARLLARVSETSLLLVLRLLSPSPGR